MNSNRAKSAAASDAALSEIETTALELARLAGTEIAGALGRSLAVRYKKTGEGAPSFSDPVSEIDHRIEVLIRARLADQFPDHAIVGEEIEEDRRRDHEFVWAIDPIDGTANFVNGFPLFAASIGVLHRGRPVAGAVWCSTSHALRAGVYHARVSGSLCFDDEVLAIEPNEAVRRHLAGEPRASGDRSVPWDGRKTGSAAIECAFVAAGLLRVARFLRPNIWDVAGGIILVKAAGGDVRVKSARCWRPLETFEVESSGDLRRWRQPVVLGEPEAVALVCQQHP